MARIALVHDIAGVAAVQASLLRDAGHEVDQIALPAHGASWDWPAKALALPVRVAAFLPTAARLRRGRYDVIHVHFLSQGLVGLLSRRRFFVQAHGSDLHFNLHNPVYRLITDVVLRRATAVFYVTPNLRSYLARHASKVVYLPNPVVPDRSIQVVPPAAVRRAVIFTRLHTVKGVAQIFPAAERLAAMGIELTALEYGPLAAAYAERYGRWVTFVKPIPHDQVMGFLAEFDVVIGQMRQGILSLMEIEALAAGRPVIASLDPALYADDPPPIVAVTGPDEIVSAMERLRSNPAELARLSKQGTEWAARNHSYARHLRILETAYFGRSAT